MKPKKKILIIGMRHGIATSEDVIGRRPGFLEIHFPRLSRALFPPSPPSRNQEIMALIKQRVKKGHKVGFEIGKEWLAEIMDPEYMGLHNMAQFIWGLRQQEAEIIPIEDEKRHYKQGKVIEKRVLSPLDRKLDKKYNKITFQRSVVHAINSLKNDVDVIVVGQNHAVHIAELLKRAGYEVELNVNRQFQKENQRLQEKASKDPVFNRRLNRLAEFINRKANSA